MNTKYMVAAALALSLGLATTARAVEVQPDLNAHINQVMSDAQSPETNWTKLAGRIDRLVAHIDEQLRNEVENAGELRIARLRLLDVRREITAQHLTSANGEVESNGEQLVSAPCEVCGAVHGAPVGPAGLDHVGGYNSFGTSGGFAGGGGGGGYGGVGFGGIGLLGGIAAAIATTFDDDSSDTIIVGPIASPSN